jgi:hypothetical protein
MQLAKSIAQLESRLIGIEACGSAQYCIELADLANTAIK